MSTGTVKLHRVLRVTPEKLFRAFTTADAYQRWIAPNGFTCQVQQFEPKVGGRFRASFTNFTSGKSHGFGGKFLEIVPAQRIRYDDKFDDPNLPGEMITTVEMKKVACGTELSITQEGIPSVIPTEMCYLGWQESLEHLARLVEPEIPD
jgi:uncharacterized protein YndB with AHSA1/START domain